MSKDSVFYSFVMKLVWPASVYVATLCVLVPWLNYFFF